MNVTVKVSLTDEQRRKLFANLYDGKKGMISRKDVNAICQASITDMLMGKTSIKTKVTVPPVRLTAAQRDEMEDGEIDWILEQNRLLTKRVNRLQHMIDTRGLKK